MKLNEHNVDVICTFQITSYEFLLVIILAFSWQLLLNAICTKTRTIINDFRQYRSMFKRRVRRYQRGNQNPYIEEEQTTQWPKKVQKDKQRSTKHTYKTKDRVTRTPLKTGGELRFSGRVSSSCSTSGTRRVDLLTNPVISRKWGKDREGFTTSGRYPWSFVTQIFHNGYQFMMANVQFSKWWLQF